MLPKDCYYHRLISERNTNVIMTRYITSSKTQSFYATSCATIETTLQLTIFINFQGKGKDLPSCLQFTNRTTLYLKNLHVKTTTNELRSIFARFEKERGPAIDYRICTGRMKGQAFITLQDTAAAVEALTFANGFVLRGKPVIIEFGRKS